MGMGPSQNGTAAGVPSKGGASARYERQYVQPSQQPDSYDGMRQIGDVMGTFNQSPATTPAGMQGDQVIQQQMAIADTAARNPRSPIASFESDTRPQRPADPNVSQIPRPLTQREMYEQQLQLHNAAQSGQYVPPPTLDTRQYSSPFGTRQSYRQPLPYQQPYMQPMYQQPYQPSFQRLMSPFGYGGLAALFSRMRGF